MLTKRSSPLSSDTSLIVYHLRGAGRQPASLSLFPSLCLPHPLCACVCMCVCAHVRACVSHSHLITRKIIPSGTRGSCSPILSLTLGFHCAQHRPGDSVCRYVRHTHTHTPTHKGTHTHAVVQVRRRDDA